MPVAEALLGLLAGKTLEKVADTLRDLRKEGRENKVSIDDSQARTSLVAHIRTVDTWSSSITLLSLLRDKKLKESFVKLSLDVGLSRHGKRSDNAITVTIDDVLEGTGHSVILGRPGAGKTTSLQRIAQSSFSDWTEGRGGVPLLVRLRDLRAEDSLTGHLLALVGLDIRFPARVGAQMRRAWEKRALLSYLDSVSAILLIDGLDEAQYPARFEVEKDLRDIVLYAGSHRVFLTCRTAEYTAPLAGAQTYTILPLSSVQVQEFAERWLGKRADSFIRAVASNPYAGTEVVPLTLAHLCAIYERDGELPPRPIDVYEQIVSLLIEEWDKQRHVVRPSRYSDFSWRKKERFLQAAAYQLAMRGRKGSFWEHDLEAVFLDIAAEFNLPSDEVHDVIREVESHTGLIHEVGYSQYDFVHLVIQEYLTAMYAHRRANAILQLMPRFPNEMALVIAYSASPEEHLAQAVDELLRNFADGSGTFVVPFLARVSVERPLWKASPRLGWLILTLFDQLSRHFRKLDNSMRLRFPSESLEILQDPAIAEAVRYAAAEADHYENDLVIRLVPRPHAQLPSSLKTFLDSQREPGLGLLKHDRPLTTLIKDKRKRELVKPQRVR